MDSATAAPIAASVGEKSIEQMMAMGDVVEQLQTDMVNMRRSVGTLHNGIAKIHNSASRTTHLTIGTTNHSKTTCSNYTRLTSDLRLLGNKDDTIVLQSATGSAQFHGSITAPNLPPLGTVITVLRTAKASLAAAANSHSQWVDMTETREVSKQDYPEVAAAGLLSDVPDSPDRMVIPRSPFALTNTDDFVSLILLA